MVRGGDISKRRVTGTELFKTHCSSPFLTAGFAGDSCVFGSSTGGTINLLSAIRDIGTPVCSHFVHAKKAGIRQRVESFLSQFIRLFPTVIVALWVNSISPEAYADEMNDAMKAREVSQIIAGAEVCGYQLSVDKTATFASDDLAEMGDLARMTFESAGGAMKIKLQEMSEIERVTKCALMKKLASKYGLTP